MPTLSAGAPLNPRGAWEAVPGQPGVSMMRSAFGGKAIDGLFLSSPAANDRLVRARHPNSNPERVIWPTGTAGAQYGASQYVGPDMIRYPESWLPPPAWQLVPPKLVEISEPNWNGVSGGLPPNVSFTSAGGMSPFYQARIGGPMDRFVGGINPGPTRTNCLLTAIGRPYPAGCAVPGGVKYEPAAFEGVVPPRNWSKVSSGLIHAIHPLGCPVEGQAVPWFDWWWRLSHVLQAPPPPPPPPPPEQQCGLHKAVEGGCCGGMNVGPAHILPSFNASLCAELCCKDPKCGVAVMTSGQGSAGIKCFLTHMNSPGKSYQPVPAGGEKSLVILTRNGTVNVSSYDDRDSLVFGEGGWQSLQGSPVGSHFYVENIRELLDSEGEYYHDAETDTLYLWRNSTQEAQHGPNASYVGTVGESVLRIVGSASSPAADITVSNLRIRHTTTDFLAPHEAPGGGDQSAHRGAAIFVEGVRNVSITGCRFDRVDGSGVFVSNWARDARILNNEFAFSGSAGIIVMGECELIDCTAGTHPQRTVIEGNLLHDGGVFSKNYLGGSIFMAKQAQSVVRGNAIWNTPRSCMTLNDGGMGGDEISANLMLNCNRETSDTGVIYTYNRLPLLSTTRTGEPSLIMQTRRIHSNLFFGNYGSGGGVDNDDGSSFYSEVGNVLYNLEVKHSTFTTGGHGKNTSRTLIVNDRGCDAGQGYFERFENNFCAMFRKPGNPPGGPLLPTQASCDPNHPTDTPDRPVPTPARSGNTYYVRNVSDWRYSCGGALWNLSEAQAHGVDVGSTVRPLGSEVEAAATFTAIARQLLGLSSPGPLRRLKSDDDPLMPWLLMPPWPPTYNLSQSTMTQSCFGPARIGKPPAVQPLTNKSGEFLRHWGIVTLDFESQEQIWGHHPGGKDSDTMMLAAAVQMKAIAPNTKIWVYRNLAQAYSNFVQLREKIEDPRYSDWWIPFGNSSTLPRCSLNPRLNKTLCSDLFHTDLGWTENGHDCGDVIPCGDYVFNHRNASLRKWLVEEHMLGQKGMAHPAVDGYLIDDWYASFPLEGNDVTKEYGPSEIPGFIGKESGIESNSTQMQELYTNWSLTTRQSLAGVRKMGGFTWSNFNCMLDTDAGYSCPPSDLAGCGLHKTEGVPRANNVESAPLWHPRHKGWDAHEYPFGGGADLNASETCASWTRTACSPDSVFTRIPTLLAWGNASTLYGDVAQFLLTRGPYGFMGYGWHGCVQTPPPSNVYDYDFGEPKEKLCKEIAPGVFERAWTKAMVMFDCNTFEANITLAGQSSQIKPKGTPVFSQFGGL